MMADFVAWDEATGRYIIGPPVMSGAEGNSGFESWNSTSELNYWAMSLEIAQKWRERLGLAREPKWDHVLEHLRVRRSKMAFTLMPSRIPMCGISRTPAIFCGQRGLKFMAAFVDR